jgi:geranylgeranyl diphosphate synthase type I
MPSSIEAVSRRYQQDVLHTMRRALVAASMTGTNAGIRMLEPFYGQMRYHLGWVDRHFDATAGQSNFGKLLRPTLLLLTYEACGADGLITNHDTGEEEEGVTPYHLLRALPAAAAIEFLHNFTLLHDDIEDGDPERRHRATVWRLWGVPLAINTGDGMCALARLALWEELREQVSPSVAMRLGRVLDWTLLLLTEGQHLDISFEDKIEIPLALYLEMIGRKTATLLRCSTEMGALLGTQDEELIGQMRCFGWALGLAFQVRDDILALWSSEEELGKRLAGDIFRRKKSLPIIHALTHANERDRERLRAIYRQELPVTPEQVLLVLDVLNEAASWTFCATFLREQCDQARAALATVPALPGAVPERARKELQTIVDFVEATAHNQPE